MPRVYVKHVIMKNSQQTAAEVQRTNHKTVASKTPSPSMSTDRNVVKDRVDCMTSKYPQNAAAEMQPSRQETTSKISSNASMGDDAVERRDGANHPRSERVKLIDSNYSKSADSDVTKNWYGSSCKLSQADNEERMIKSESQTPVSTDDRCRVSRTSSLDSLRLRFQQQKTNAGRIRSDLDHLKKKVIATQHELNEERDSRRKLEEWTGYLESQLETNIASQSLLKKQLSSLTIIHNSLFLALPA